MPRQVIAEIQNTGVIVARKVDTAMMRMYWSIGKRLTDVEAMILLVIIVKAWKWEIK